MPLQSQNLRMTTLEVLNHQPLKPHHPQLKDGIHLRWNPGEDIDFPWFGYYLLRRDHIQPTEVRCMHIGWIRPDRDSIPYITANVGLTAREYMYTQFGIWVSDKRLRLTDDFPPQQITDNTRMVEVDLEDRQFARFVFSYSVNAIAMYIGFRSNSAVTIEYELFDKTIHKQVIDGNANQIVPVVYSADAVTSIKFHGTSAAIVALCHTPVDQNWLEGWEFIQGLSYPICLPANHANYPCPNKPNTANAARNLAINRIRYGDPNKWLSNEGPGTPTHVERLRELTTALVENGPGGTAMHDISTQYVEESEPNPGDPEVLNMPSQKPMNLVLLGALDPAVAQMTGLYFVDETAQPDIAYDYLIVADHTGVFKTIIETQGTNGIKDFTKTLKANISTAIDGWICYNRKLQQVTDLQPPQNIKVYALPGMTVRDESTGLIKNSQERNSAGLTWDLGLTVDNLLKPNKPVMYELWRHFYGPQKPSGQSINEDFEQTSDNPFVVIKLDAAVEAASQTSTDFPPFRLMAYDNYLADGWYSYKLAGRDLFGRFSDLSQAASWHQWSPAPDPKPHYYINPPGNQQLNSFAVHLLDLTPPPPPTSTEAYALDVEDQFMVKDSEYNTWRTSIENESWYQALTPEQQGNLIGLRVRWQWTLYHIRQAPATIAFRVHFNPGYSPPANSALATSWNNFLLEVDYDEHVKETVRGMKDINGQDLEGLVSNGKGALVAGNLVTIPVGYDLKVVRRGFEHILLVAGNSRQIFRVVAVDLPNRRLTLNGNPTLGNTVSWRVGLLLRQYEVFLPEVDGSLLSTGLAGLNPMLASPDNFIPTLEFPKSYANIGVNAVEEKSDRRVEGNVGASAKIFRVLRSKPAPPPPIPPDSDKVFASPADYHGNSYYTYRWKPANFLRTHIYRALDESIFICDYVLRPKSAGDTNLMINAADDIIFPDASIEPLWDNLKRETIANELNALNTATRNATNQSEALQAYRLLSNDALRILAGLPHNKKAFQQITIHPLESSDPKTTNALGPDNPDNYPIDASLKKYIDALPGKAANRYFYRAAYVDNAENISGMNLPTVPIYLPDVVPPKKPVITKITAGQKEIKLQWASQNGRGLNRFRIYATADRGRSRDIRLMEKVADLPLNCLTVESGAVTLGISTDVTEVVQIYQANSFDPMLDWLTGQTSVGLLATPATPVSGVVSGLAVADGTEVVAVYTDSNGGLQFTACRHLPRCWNHAGLTGGKVYYYRIESMKTTVLKTNTYSIPSPPSVVASGKPYDQSPPVPPTITTIEWVKVNEQGDVFAFDAAIPIGEQRFSAVRLVWTATDLNLRCMVQYRNSAFPKFRNSSKWLSKGQYEFIQRNNLDYLDQEYRVKVINEAGNVNKVFNIGNLSGN